MTFARRVLVSAALAILAACASVQMAATERDFAAKEFAKPSRGKAALYVYRNESIAGTVKMSLQLDGALLGETGPRTFHWVTLSPGKHTFFALLVDDQHAPLNPPVSAPVNLVVQ